MCNNINESNYVLFPSKLMSSNYFALSRWGAIAKQNTQKQPIKGVTKQHSHLLMRKGQICFCEERKKTKNLSLFDMIDSIRFTVPERCRCYPHGPDNDIGFPTDYCNHYFVIKDMVRAVSV